MDGHVRQRGKKWAVVIFMGLDEKGKRKYKWYSGYNSRPEAKKALVDILHDLNKGTYVDPAKETIGAYMEQWLSDKKVEVRYNTFKKYHWLTTQHIIPELGRIEISKLTPQRLQAFYTHLQTMDKPISNRSILHLHTMLHQAFERAVKWGMLARNVVDAVDPPKPQNKEMSTWTGEEIMQFLEVAKKDRYYMVFLLAIATGMRKAEVCGIRWQDIDFENGRVNVRQSTVQEKGKYVYEGLKTEKSRRIVSLPSQIVEELKRHKRKQAEEKLSYGKYYNDDDLVCCRENGLPVSYSNLQKHWLKLIDDAGLPRIRIHDLRHSHATLLFEQGVPTKIISERLGHSRVNVTLDIYTHVKPEQQDDVAQKFGDNLFSSKKKIR